jgi:iron complex outermembrane receptor protein
MPQFHSARILAFLLSFGAVPILGAQQRAAKDTTAARRDTLETVTVRAVRAAAPAPGAQHTIARDEIRARYAGQDAPLFLTTAPSVTAYTESGSFSGYSYIRLRGVDQTRLNISFDGVPLNDPEDQVLYFSNVAGFMQSVQSVQVTRGVGASSFGTASYAGSLNFQSIPLATTPRGGDLQIVGGSYNTQGLTAQFATGVSPEGFAAYGRVTAQRTDGYRKHSGNEAKSTYLSAGWFGDRDAVKLSGFAGLSGTRLAYYASTESVLATDPTDNPLSTAEGDLFHQEMASLQWTHAFSDGLRTTLTTYRNSAAGAYDVDFGSGTFANYALAHVWVGAIGALQLTRGAWSLDAGFHASDYHREHALAMRPTLSSRVYANTGYKQEQSAFGKVGYTVGDWRLAADLQLRRAAFQYHPSTGAKIAPFGTEWTFVNPKLSLAYAAHPGVELFASWGQTGREPARADLFAGADDVDATNVASILPLGQVRPERLNDFEAGVRWTGSHGTLSANLFDMEFRDEVLAIGKISLTGNPLRRNVDRSYRRGVEFEGSWRLSDAWTTTANLTWMQARIASYTDEPSGKTYRDVEPIATPPVTFNDRLIHRASDRFSWDIGTRFVDRGHLANDGNADMVTPSFWLFDAGVTWRVLGADWRLEMQNLADRRAYASGYEQGGERAFYPLAGRNVLLTARIGF